MTHLSEEAVVRAAGNGPDEASDGHLAECARCRQRVECCRAALDALAEHARTGPELPPGLARWALAYAGSAAPPHSGSWKLHLLDLLAGGAPLATAVRGAQGASQATLYGDDSYHLDLRVDPSNGGRRLHGQVVALEGGDQAGWRVAVVTSAGTTLVTDTDDHGEFWFDGVESTPGLTVVAERDRQRLVIPRITVIDPTDGSSGDRTHR